MLILTRKLKQGIVIQDNIVVTVLAVDGERVKLGIAAPPDVVVLRQELCQAVEEENRAAAGFPREQVSSVVQAFSRLKQPVSGEEKPTSKSRGEPGG
jgi:carbon storage regulator